MSVGSAAEEDEVEEGEFDGVARREDGDEEFFVLVCHFLRVVEVFFVDGVDFWLRECLGDFVEEFGAQEGVVGVGVVEGHTALVGVEDFPFAEVGFGIVVVAAGAGGGA